MPEMDGFALAAAIQKDPGLAGVTIMMLTSAGHLGDAERCRSLGITGYLVKPVRQSELLDAVCQMLGRKTSKQAELVTRHSLREAKHRARILLVEDNAVNRTLAVRLLEKRGYVVSVAANGREAVDAVQRDEFAVILMDIQMPEMDRFEATAAMTAHALKGDQGRCLEARHGCVHLQADSQLAALRTVGKGAGFPRRERQHRGRHAGRYFCANVKGGWGVRFEPGGALRRRRRVAERFH